MATAARPRPEILSSLWVRMAQPLVDAAEHARQALGGHMEGFPSADRLTEGGVQGRYRRDAELGADQGKALVIAGQETSPMPVYQVQQDGVGEIQGMRIRQLKDRDDISASEVDEHNGTVGNLGELLGDERRVFAVHLCEDGLGLKQHPRRREPAGVGRSNCSHAVAAGCPCSRLYTRIIVSSPHCSGGLEEEVISAHLRNLGGGGGISRPGGESVGEDVVPGHFGMGTDQDALVGLDQNDLVLQPEGLGPLRRKANPIPRFDHGGLGRIHRCLNGATAVRPWKWTQTFEELLCRSSLQWGHACNVKPRMQRENHDHSPSAEY